MDLHGLSDFKIYPFSLPYFLIPAVSRTKNRVGEKETTFTTREVIMIKKKPMKELMLLPVHKPLEFQNQRPRVRHL